MLIPNVALVPKIHSLGMCDALKEPGWQTELHIWSKKAAVLYTILLP
jgi:hypothetical protein